MAQPKTVVNARNLRNGWGLNGITFDANGATAMNTLKTRWVRDDMVNHSGDSTPGNKAKGLITALQNASVPDPNPKFQAIINYYVQPAWSWSAQKTYLATALQLTTPNGNKLFAAIEGPNEIGDDSDGGGGGSGYNPDTTNVQHASNQVDGAADTNTRQCFGLWSQAMAQHRSANTSLYNGVELLSPTILDGILFNTAPTLPGDRKGSATSGAGLSMPSGTWDYGTIHWYPTASAGWDTADGVHNDLGGNIYGLYLNHYYGYVSGMTNGNTYSLDLVCSEVMLPMQAGPAKDGVSVSWSMSSLLLDHFALGGRRVMFYTATGNDGGQGGGSTATSGYNWFANYPNNPNPVAKVMANMSHLFSLKNNYDDSSNFNDTASFSPSYTGTPSITVNSGTPDFSMVASTNGQTPSYLVMPKSDGSTMIAVWREPKMDNGTSANTSQVPGACNVTVNWGSSKTYKVWDPTGGTGGNNTTINTSPSTLQSSSGSSATFNLYAVPLFIELQGVTVTSAPSQPSGLSVTRTTSSRVTISWTTATTGTTSSPSGYKLQYQKGSTAGTWLQFGTTDLSSNSFTYYGLDISSTYYFRIIATNDIGDSTASAAVSTTTSGTATTTTPAIVGSNYSIVREDASNVASRTLSLPSMPSNGNTVLVTYSGYGANGGNSSAITAPSGATKLLGPIYDGAQEVIWAWKFTANGSTNSFGPFTDFLSTDHAGWAIAEVSNWSTEEISHGNVTTGTSTAVGWTVPTPSSSNNVILALLSETYAATIGSPSSGTTILVAAAASVSYHQNILLKAASGSVSIGLSGGTAGNDAAYMNFIVYGSGPPSQVTGVTASNTTANQTNLSWTSLGSSATSYKVELSTNGGTTKTVVSQTIAGSTSGYTVTGLTASTSYTFYVTAANDSGYGTTSSAASVTTTATPTIQYVQSAIATDQSATSSLTVTLTNAPTVGNYLVFYFIAQKGTTTLNGIPTSTIYKSALAQGSNTDNTQASWVIAAADTTKSWTVTGYVDLATFAVVEVKGVSSMDTPTVVTAVTYADGGHVDPTVVAPSDTSKAVGIYFIGQEIAPDSWGTMPTGITQRQAGPSSTYASNGAIKYHTASVYELSQSLTAGTKQIPFTSGATQGAAPMLIGYQFIGATATATPPGQTVLSFGTITSNSISYTWSAASGTVDHYVIARSTSSSMSNPTSKSVTGLSSNDTGLSGSTDYWFTITAFNGTTSGTTSTAQKATTTAAAAATPILVGGVPFVLDSTGLPILKK